MGEEKIALSEADKQVIMSVNRARAMGKWFVAVWSVDERGGLHRHFRTEAFPIGCFQQCQRDLNEFVDQESPDREVEDLPEADLQLFLAEGEADEESDQCSSS